MSTPASKIKELTSLLDKTDLKDYGKTFQIKLLSLIIKDKAFSYKITPILKTEYFTDIYIRGIYNEVLSYLKTYYRPPTLDNLETIINTKIDTPKLYLPLLKKLDEIDVSDRDFVTTNAHDFCFKRHAESELSKLSQKIKLGKFEEAQTIAFELFKFNTGSSTKIYSLKNDLEMVFNEDDVINPLPTIFPTFNDNMQGGPGKGKLVIAVAPSNFGKTNFLVATARKLNEEGKNVVLFSFEIGGSDIYRRHIAGLVDVKQSEVKYSKSVVEQKVGSEKMGDFILVEEKATKATIGTIVQNLNYLKSQGIFPDCILIDSLNQLKLPPGIKYEGDNRMFEYLAEEVRDLAKDEALPIYMVYQGNRSSFKSEVNDEQNIGKAIEPLQVADALMFFSQTPPMIEQGKCYVNLLKNRMGKKAILLDCKYDPDKCIFEEIGVVNRETMLTPEQAEKVVSSGMKHLERIKSERQQLSLGKIK